MRAAVVLNPSKSRHASVAEAVLAATGKVGWPEPIITTTTEDEPGGAQAREAVAGGAEVVLVAGGDGTVRHVAHALAGTGVPMGIIPLGTANLFARTVGLRTRETARNIETALHGLDRPTDVGLARWQDRSGQWQQEQPFMVVAGVGHDARTVLETPEGGKGRLGWTAYLRAGVRHMSADPIRMDVSYDGAPARTIEAWSLLAANCGRLPLGVRLTPSGYLDDGVLETMEVTPTSVKDWSGIAAKGVFGLNREVDGVSYGQAATVTVTPSRPTPIQVDGDAFDGATRLKVSLLEAQVLVRVPKPRRFDPLRRG